MKNINIILMITLLSISSCLVYFLTEKSDGTTDIQLKETPKTYSFRASFDPAKMPRVTNYLSNYLAPEGVVDVSETFDKKIVLKDNTTFQLETSAGEVEITAAQKSNPAYSIVRIRKMGAEIKDIIMQE